MPVESLCKALDPIGATPRSVVVVSDAIEWRRHFPSELMPVAFACALCACSAEASAAVAVFERAERVFAEVHSHEAQHNGCTKTRSQRPGFEYRLPLEGLSKKCWRRGRDLNSRWASDP
jgi:hypothetical protein